MSDGRIVATILLGLVAALAGGIAGVLLIQTLSGLGAGGLAFTGLPILALGGISAAAIVAISRLNGRGDKDAE